MKRKFILVILSLLTGVVMAQERIVPQAVLLPQGGKGELVVGISLNENHNYVSFQFTVNLPSGVSFVSDVYGNAEMELGDCLPSAVYKTDFPANNGIVKVYSSPSTIISAHDGELVRIPIQADASLNIGDKLTVNITGVEFATIEAQAVAFGDEEASIEVVENVTILDENSTAAPVASDGAVNVKVKRTIAGNVWSTIVLPFAMTAEQVTSAFGSDVELADFSSWSSEEDEDGNIVKLELGFTDVTEMEANHPYIIKTSVDITEFTADGVDIEVEDEPTVQVGKKKAERGYFIGTYVAGLSVPESNLFVSGNQFWYSTGKTKMKAFRAYFELADVLTEVESAPARIRMSFGDEATGISDVHARQSTEGLTYNLQGQVVEHPGRGLYIRGGKKIFNHR